MSLKRIKRAIKAQISLILTQGYTHSWELNEGSKKHLSAYFLFNKTIQVHCSSFYFEIKNLARGAYVWPKIYEYASTILIIGSQGH